ncbi:DUF4837 family protein [Neolewinella lacunae]|uniref:DUF4837 family protein n=1 Tax=Neolewinella lacunae TaxID=1517758 RepID=A0A923TAT6_9BACT|nr:DUF4837 family protein [Neolewinella lacunae]MBC6996819.1 DUF4837 family protein [Neolewinella lacunae]MDN3633797.1 DUF4837 family protein [Neolewinella lacunae]
MTQRFFNYLLALLLGSVAFSCGDEMQQTLQPTPSAFGRINSLTVVADSSLWMNGARDSVAYFFESPYIILPQPEPIFDVRHIEPGVLSSQPTFRELRNYLVLADLSDENSPATQMVIADLNDAKIQQVREEGFGSAVARNKWATGQQLVYLMGRNRQELLDGLSVTYPAVVKRIAERENERVKVTTYFQGIDRRLGDTVAVRSGARIDIPGGYELVPIDARDFAWLRKSTKGGSLNIMVTRVPYERQSQLTKEGLKEIRDQIGREYISSTLSNTYMKVNDSDLPLFTESTQLNGAFAIEGRGIWEMENDFQAGPFLSYLINDEADRQLVLIDGFVLAPGEKKRELMSELQQVLLTAEVQ